MKMKNLLIGLAVVGLAAFWGWFLFTVTSGRSVFSSILPGLVYSGPSGTDPVDIDLVAEVVNAQHKSELGSDQVFYEWKLTVPRSYYMGEIYGDHQIGAGGNARRSTFYVLYDEATGAFAPGNSVDALRQKNAAYINVTNTPASQELIGYGKCLRDLDRYRFTGRGDRDWLYTCQPEDQRTHRCRVVSHYKGWNVELAIPKQEYFGNYNAYCQKVTGFLESITTEIQPMLNQSVIPPQNNGLQ